MSHEERAPAQAGPIRAFLGLGSSLSPEKHIRSALSRLSTVPEIELTGISTFYRTPPLPAPGASISSVADDPDFLNGVLEIRTTFSPEEVEGTLAGIEQAESRIRSGDKYAPRTLDLDLLLCVPLGREVVPEEQPFPAHDDIRTRAWVALPLFELAPELLLPPDGTPLAEVAETFPGAGGVADRGFTRSLRSAFLEVDGTLP